ncbi:MAG: prephenate dehydrogenase/arogenate dehydrogenase family protein, partial [Dehalococcoidia bacterium]
MSTIALMGAGGKMGLRIARNLKDNTDYKTLYVEISDAGKSSLAELGLSATPQDEALQQADVVILALPDKLIGSVCNDMVPKLRSGTMVMGLDPAAGYAGVLTEREGISYFISHPGHPPLFGEETDIEAQRDWFGGVKAKQNIVCSLHQGPEKDYAKGEAIARVIFAPVSRAHRVTTEQMALLEPALVETLALTCFMVIREAMEEIIRMGVPQQAAFDFLMGHIRTTIAIVFDYAGAP